MTEKQCFKCLSVKPLNEFYKHPQMPDGHLNKCKDCTKNDVKENRLAKIEYYKQYDKQRGMRPDRVEMRKLYQASDQGKQILKKLRTRYAEKNPIKRAAAIMVGNAVRDRKLIKPDSCEKCFAKPSRLCGHHDDYAFPLVVRWLCSKCHRQWHIENGEGKNG